MMVLGAKMSFVDVFKKVVSWFKVVLTDLGLENPLKSVGATVSDVAEGLTLLGVGLIFGFVARRYLKLLVFALVVLVGGVKLLEFKGFLTVDWASMYSNVAITNGMPVDSLQGLLLGYLDWMKANVVASCGLIIGLYFGMIH